MSKQALLAGSARLERKDDQPDVKAAIETVSRGFEEFKAANDERLKEIEKKGSADPLLDDKLTKINGRLDQYEGISQRLTTAEAKAKAVDELNERFDKLETAFKRRGSASEDDTKVDRVGLWAKSVVLAHSIGVPNLSDEQRAVLQAVNDEYKSLSVSNDTAGGYLAPVELVREIIKAETLMSPVRSLARVRQTANKSVQIPKRTGQFAAQWVAEQGSRSETTGLTYGLEEIPTHEVYALVDISNQMLEDSAFNMNDEISMEASEQFAVAEGTAFVTGNAVGKPEGFMTNSSVAETVSGTAANIADSDGQANGLLTLKHAIKTAYAVNGTWVMNRTTLGAVRKLKDGDKNYIWMPGIALGKPNSIDGDPYVELPDMPSEGANLYPIAYGDFRRAYTWVDRISMEMLRDPYTQATSGNVRFIMRKRVAGQVVLAEAIRKLKCST
jgi:HK97 family phage major capsid protein